MRIYNFISLYRIYPSNISIVCYDTWFNQKLNLYQWESIVSDTDEI